MDRAEIRTLVRTITRTETQDVDDAALDLYLDEGYAEIVSNRPWPWTYVDTPETVVLTPDVNEYTLGATVRRVVAVIEVEQRYPLTNISINDWARRQDSIQSTSRPVWYVYQAGKLKLWPVPATNDSLDVYYHAFPVWDTDPPVFDSTFHTAIADWSMSRLWEQEEDLEKANDYRQRFEIKMTRMAKFYNTEMLDRPMIYGGGDAGVARPHSMPWLSDARLGGATG